MYWLIVISRRQRGLCIIWSPDCIFIVHVKKTKTCLYHSSLIFFYGLGWSKQAQFFDLRGQRRTFFPAGFICCRRSRCQAFPVIDWFQQSSSDYYLRSHFEAKSSPVFIPALLLRLRFVLTSLCTWKIRLFFQSVWCIPFESPPEASKPNHAPKWTCWSIRCQYGPSTRGIYSRFVILLNINAVILKNDLCLLNQYD